jgi:hypothetical protein
MLPSRFGIARTFRVFDTNTEPRRVPVAMLTIVWSGAAYRTLLSQQWLVGTLGVSPPQRYGSSWDLLFCEVLFDCALRHASTWASRRDPLDRACGS